ncbi:2-amino-4-hydroxy-6-hydroxymethyldihydropteridine diphosphokinase [Photorhabdus khanii]|uniref:2-amino-4-hydroxy-6-hydroxymethyldihydropteridine pyrophosphokinase n=1 Tax=Photorhabdus khanii subsp. guanajuatensis TaxID=2100166 RepID=A0A4R4JWL4_9GAMM|nr:2-amino-4-hydroxy-6-hydroxymethyldihydropteridine diphosphokinase [Photorhabdus khanii]TDB59023.1 2-amino-4-hydroxy-6-hydroxymethyldihydropteridine diphosphokinase [Photorhabdus khanii subsp. guanajuatensis]
MTCVYIAVGSNLAEPVQQVKNALAALEDLPETEFIASSSWYRTKPMGPQNQPDFLNMAVALETTLAPEELLNHTQAIELAQGRVRKDERWGPRTLDLDIMLFGDQVIDTERLTIPHYGLKQREFMLYPLAEIAPDLVFPDGEALSERLKHIPENGLVLWQPPQPSDPNHCR